MLGEVFLTINTWTNGGLAIAALGCFLWGAVSVVFSPCHLVSIPLIVSYVAGQERALKANHSRRRALVPEMRRRRDRHVGFVFYRSPVSWDFLEYFGEF
jgi:cytochrome c biogenesis protein CcdA